MTIPIHDLAAPFPPDQVKQRRGSFGKELAYVEAHNVIARLNDALDGTWSFAIVSTQVEPDEVIVRGRLTIGDTHREQYGGSKITRHRDTGEILNLADDLKSAASEALKKCASLVGVGAYLYGDNGGGGNGSGPSRHAGHNGHSGRDRPSNHNGNGDNHRTRFQNPSAGNGRLNGHAGGHPQGQPLERSKRHQQQDDDPQANARQQSPRVSNDQIARIVQAARDNGIPQKDLIQLSRDTFGAVLSQLSPAQADDLISLIGAAA